MNIAELIPRPITTPEYPDPTEARRFIHDEYSFYGYDYVFLEDATWNALVHIAQHENCTAGELCSHIDLNFAHRGAPFAPAARLYVLRYVADRLVNVELPPELLFLRDLTQRGRLQ